MLLVVERLFSIPWIYCIAHISRLWRSHLAHIFRRGPPSPSSLRPLTDQQRKLKGAEFIGSIDTNAIRALASKYNGSLPYSIRSRRQGSFNVCFVLNFSDSSTRLIKLPIEPVVHNVWIRCAVRSIPCNMC
ncbi:hypothetical protein BKA65DRAFT_107480 [Rhexocercosporidium sp. MPI-PUGE-AT-0058]|nr:hypothetical protein BKA65DRAFT_107480 [Rhexocercosporidium sp. MPI-PUGE-AT-0058]